MSKTILLAVDASSVGSAAAEMARDLASDSGDRVVVLHVHEFAVGRFGRIQVDCADGEGERVVTDIVAGLQRSGVTAEAEIRKTPVGHVAKTILSAADEVDARMVVLGSASTHDVPHLPFGNVSLRLLHLATRPVLIVPRSPAAVTAAEPVVPVAAAATS
ncbi:MAG TPA: universal stress protein [Streptosporangiaceae bacterium]|nr:universal stress protein [Streptosporangiaceae bacterium]